jgi:AcrR family transcriptional regulator
MPRPGLTPTRVVDAAAVLADRDGFGPLTLAAVAAELGVRLPSLYNHVQGLDDLRRALALRACAALHDVLAEAIGGRSGDEALRSAALAYRRWAREHPGLYAAAQRAPNNGDVEHEEAAAKVVETLVAALRSRAMTRDQSVHMVRVLRAALHGFMDLELNGGFGLPLKVDASYAHLVDMLMAGLDAVSGDRMSRRRLR